MPEPVRLLLGGDDLVVDACDGVWVLGNLGYGFGRLARYDPATGDAWVAPGNIDQGQGTIPLRFGRAAGQEHLLTTMVGGWQTNDVHVQVWDVGVGQAPWP